MKRIGILGGSFNPPTIGHIFLSHEILESNRVDEIWIMPAYSHTQKNISIPFDIRCEMCELAICHNNNNIKVSRFESIYPKESSTFHLIQRLMIEFPACQFHFIIGMDQANNMESWYENKKLKDLIPFLIIPRRGVGEIPDWINTGHHKYLTKITPPRISSTQVRKYLEDPILRKTYKESFLPISVQEYILSKNLYT